MKKFVFLLPLTGLCVSLLIIGHDRSKADSLKQTSAHKATGTGQICNDETCNNGNGCVDFGSSRITWFPKFKCTAFLFYGVCNDTPNGTCWHKDLYPAFNCPTGVKNGSTNHSEPYCGLAP